MSRKKLWLWAVGGLLVFTACTASGASSTSPGTLIVEISDHREAIGDFERLDMTIERIGLHPANAPRTGGWLDFKPNPAVVDLTQVVGGPTVIVLQTTTSAGAYDAVRLAVSGSEGVLKTDNSVTFPGFEETARLLFTIQGDDTITLVIDMIVESLEDHPDSGYQMNLLSVTTR